jgi:hypothetical protein
VRVAVEAAAQAVVAGRALYLLVVAVVPGYRRERYIFGVQPCLTCAILPVFPESQPLAP